MGMMIPGLAQSLGGQQAAQQLPGMSAPGQERPGMQSPYDQMIAQYMQQQQPQGGLRGALRGALGSMGGGGGGITTKGDTSNMFARIQQAMDMRRQREALSQQYAATPIQWGQRQAPPNMMQQPQMGQQQPVPNAQGGPPLQMQPGFQMWGR